MMTTQHDSAIVVNTLENFLAQHSAFTPTELAKLDDQEIFPEQACLALNEFGLAHWYIPSSAGGALTDHADLLRLWRAVARHDLTIAIAHGKTFLGCICTWVNGSFEQQEYLRRQVQQGTPVALALTERHHGADLLANEFSAIMVGPDWILSGEKWLINNATRAPLICILTKTDEISGPRSFSLFLVDKRKLPADSYSYLPKQFTHGIRGADISGIALKQAKVKPHSLIAPKGTGLETVLKSLQVTRIMCAGLSLGAADHGLMILRDFTAQHRLYDQRLIDLPMTRHNLGRATVMSFIAQAVSIVAGRAVQALSGELSVIAAITKAFVPSLIDEMISLLGEQLGARAFLSEQFHAGHFQKLERDHRIVAIFDGSTAVNRNALINQFPRLTQMYRKRKNADVSYACDLQRPLPPFAAKNLSLTSSTGCSLVQNISNLLHAMPGDSSLQTVALANEFLALVDSVIGEMERAPIEPRNIAHHTFLLAENYEFCFAGAAVLHYWYYNRQNRPGQECWWQDDLWLYAALTFIMERLRSKPASKSHNWFELLTDLLEHIPLTTSISIV